MTQPQPQPYYQPPQPPKSNTTTILVIVIVVVVVVALIGGILAFSFLGSLPTSRTQHALNVVNGLITVQAGGYNTYPITMSAGTTNVVLSGSFTASGGSGNDIEVFVMDQTNYINWQNGHQATAYYDSGQLTTATINVNLPTGAGNYDLVYSNTFSAFSAKNVQTVVDLTYNY